MKRQIILISRIYTYSEGEEFHKYVTNEIHYKDGLIKKETSKFRLLILKGSNFYKDSPKPTEDKNADLHKKSAYKRGEANRLFTKAFDIGLMKSCETLILYHDNNKHDDDFNFALHEAGWTDIHNIIKYGSRGNEENIPLYKNILNPLGRAIKEDNQQEVEKLIGKLWDKFFFDPILESKLNLLQNILSNELKHKLDEEILSDTTLNDIQEKYDEFRKVEQVQNYELFSLEYQNAYSNFRGALNIEV